MLEQKIEEIKNNNRLIMECEAGSYLYNLNRPSSDHDVRGIFMPSVEELFCLNGFEQEIADEKEDIKYYSLDKFLRLAMDCNPNIIELLYVPENSLFETSPVYQELQKERRRFISQKAKHTFSGYAFAQIKKCRGNGKKANSIKRYVSPEGYYQWALKYKESPDFVIQKMGKNFVRCLNEKKLFDGISVCPESNEWERMLPNPINSYIHQYIDVNGCPFRPVKFKGDINIFDIEKIEGQKNMYRLYRNGSGFIKAGNIVSASIDKSREQNDFAGVISIDEDNYKKDHNDFESFWEWMCNRNEERYATAWNDEKTVDCKNLMHCMRLLLSGKNIAKYGEPLVRFEGVDRDYLLSIREGYEDVDKVLEKCDKMMLELEDDFKNSTLPYSCDKAYVEDFYKNICFGKLK